MKRTLLIICMAAVAMNMSAQLVVDNRGHVAISHTTPRANFDITRVGVPGDSAERDVYKGWEEGREEINVKIEQGAKLKIINSDIDY